MTKLCPACKVSKLLGAFSRDRSACDGLQRTCRTCQQIVRKAYYASHLEQEIANAVAWARANPEAAREKDRRRAIKRPGRTTAQARSWRQRNRDRAAVFGKTWRKNNKDLVRLTARVRYRKDPDKDLARQHRRRVLLAAGGSFTKQEIDALFTKQRGACAICRGHLGKRFHRDHVMPLAKGGTNDIANIQLLCRTCNAQKGARDPVEFMQSRGLLI